MRVFVTGATGFIGAALVPELIGAGHQVLGLCRSPDKAPALAAAGAEVVMGSLADERRLTEAAARADGVIHLAFNHDFSRYAANCEDDRRAIGALGEALAGSAKPLVVTSGTAMALPLSGRPATEDTPAIGSDVIPRAATEEAAAAAAARGVHVSVMRLPQVHNTVLQGLVSPAIAAYRQNGVCAYIGEGRNRWPAAHRLDVARLYRLALERAAPWANYHAVAEEGVSQRAIAETLAKRLGLPVRSITSEEAAGFFGWLAMFAGLDLPASGALTRQRLGWAPSGPGLLEDLAQLELA